MNNTPQKLKLIYSRFLALAVIIIAGYTFIHWLLFIQWQVFPLNEDILNFWIPFALPWIPGFIWLQRRIKLLRLKTRSGDLPGLYVFVACFAIAIPTTIAQSYLQTATGKLTRLDDISQIAKQPPTKYYTLNKFYIDKAHPGVNTTFKVSGKNGQYFEMNIYFVLPILTSPADTANASCAAWYGVKYHEQISNNLSRDAKEALFQAFADGSQANFEKRDHDQFVYFDRIGNNDDHKGYLSAIGKNTYFSGNSTTVLVPVDEPFESRNGNKLPWIFGSFAIGAAVWLIMILIPPFDEAGLQQLHTGKTRKSGDGKEILSLFLPRKGFFITPIIVDLNILVFLAMVFAGLGFVSFDAPDLVAWGANYKPLVAGGQWWRLVTSIFLHGGIMHLFANTFGLVFAGIFLEPRIGRVRFAGVYLATGILASITSLWWHDATVSVGASGAIFGLYGTLLALILTKAYPKDFGKAFLVSILIFVGYNLLMGLKGSIDNAAHLGGLISGFTIGLVLSRSIKAQGVPS